MAVPYRTVLSAVLPLRSLPLLAPPISLCRLAYLISPAFTSRTVLPFCLYPTAVCKIEDHPYWGRERLWQIWCFLKVSSSKSLQPQHLTGSGDINVSSGILLSLTSCRAFCKVCREVQVIPSPVRLAPVVAPALAAMDHS